MRGRVVEGQRCSQRWGKGISPHIRLSVWGGNIPRRTEKPRRGHEPVLGPSPVLWALSWSSERQQARLIIDRMSVPALCIQGMRGLGCPFLLRKLSLTLAFLVSRCWCCPSTWPTIGLLAVVQLRLKDAGNGCFHPTSRFGVETEKKNVHSILTFPKQANKKGKVCGGLPNPPSDPFCICSRWWWCQKLDL